MMLNVKRGSLTVDDRRNQIFPSLFNWKNVEIELTAKHILNLIEALFAQHIIPSNTIYAAAEAHRCAY